MTDTNREYLSQALSHLENYDIAGALPLLRQYAAANRAGSLLDTLQKIEQSYTFLLKYLAEGLADPGREKLFTQLRSQLSAIAANLLREDQARESAALFDSVLRSARYSNLNFADPLGRFISADAALQLMEVYTPDGQVCNDARQLLNEKDRAMKDIFNYVWTIPAGSGQQLKPIVNVAIDSDISYGLRSLIVSALILSLLRNYDSACLSALLDIEERTPDGRIRAHALTGILLSISANSVEVDNDLDMGRRINKWMENPDTESHLHDAAIAIVKTRGSARLASRVQNEILPGLTDIGKDILKNVKIDSPEISLEQIQENPEWERIMSNSGFDRKIRRLNDMQKKGADMMLPMYGQMAANFYFKDIDRWFRAFEIWESARLGLTRDLTELLAKMPQTPMMCDTDKYILLLNLSHIPVQARDMLTASFRAGGEEMQAEFNDLSLHSSEPDFDMELTNYAKILFRFFTYFRLHKEFANPFDSAVDFTALPYIGELFYDDDLLHTIGESYFHQGYYSDAAGIYSSLCEYQTLPSPIVLQKLGYCYEKDNEYQKALDCYSKADTLSDGKDKWLLKRIIDMANKCCDSDIELFTLDHLIDIDKDNTDALRDWLEIVIRTTPFNDGDEMMSRTTNRLNRLKYLYPDDSRTISLDACYNFMIGEYPKVIDILTPVRNEMELMLGASALGDTLPGINADTRTDTADEKHHIADDMLILTSAYAATDRNDEAVAVLNAATLLVPDRSTYTHLYQNLKTIWQSSPLLRENRIMIPMLIQAATADPH